MKAMGRLTHVDPAARERALADLAQFSGIPEVREALEQAIGGDRTAALHTDVQAGGFRPRGSEAATPTTPEDRRVAGLLELLRHPDPDIRVTAIRELEAHADRPEVAEALPLAKEVEGKRTAAVEEREEEDSKNGCFATIAVLVFLVLACIAWAWLKGPPNQAILAKWNSAFAAEYGRGTDIRWFRTPDNGRWLGEVRDAEGHVLMVIGWDQVGGAVHWND